MMNRQSDFKKGSLLYQERSYKEAIEAFSAVLKDAPNHVESIYQISMCFLHLGQYDEALKGFDKAAELEPEKPFRYASRAYLKDRMGDTHGAIKDYERATELDPQDAISYNNLGLLLEKLGRKSQADKMVKQADKLAASEEYRKREIEKLQNQKEYANYIDVLVDVFTRKEARAEFWDFIKRGFKA